MKYSKLVPQHSLPPTIPVYTLTFRLIHNICYHVRCGNKKCKSCYVGQTKRRNGVRNGEHAGKDQKSHVLCHSKETKHRKVSLENVKILGSGYRALFKRRISEALFIKEFRPDLNVQEEAFKLNLFN